MWFCFIDRVIEFSEIIWGQTHLILVRPSGENLVVGYKTLEPVNEVENNASRLKIMERVASFEARNPSMLIEIES